MHLPKKIDKPLAIILLLYVFFSFFMITKFPKVWIDSSWCSMASYTLATEGRLANPILRGRGQGLEEHLLTPQVAHRVLLAGIYKTFGFGLVQSRALSIFAGFFLILSTYYFTRRYYDGKIATLAIILLASDNVFFVTARSVREDILAACFAATGFLLFVHALESKSIRCFAFSGLLMGVSLYTHPNSFLVLIAILIIFFSKYKSSMFISKEFWIFCLFSLIAFAPYAFYVIREDLGNNFAHFTAQIGGNANYLDRNYLQNLLGEYKRFSNYIYFPRRILIFLVQIAALVYAVQSKERVNKYLLVLVLTFVILLPLWNPGNPTPRYFIVFVPAVSILVSSLLVAFFRKVSPSKFKTLEFKKRIGYTIAGVIVLLFFVNQIGGDVYILWKHRNNDYHSFTAEIEKAIPKEAKIWGSTTFWIGLHDYPYITQSSPYEEVEKFQPEYAILYDSAIWGQVSATVGRKDETVNAYRNIRDKMESLCSRQGVFIRRIENKFYGDVEIYKINWSK